MTNSSPSITFTSYSALSEQRHEMDWYEWCVFVEGPSDLLELIAFVEYTLHPTFPDPVRICVDRDHRFALLSAGWGGFGISIAVSWIDGSVTRHRFFLELDRDHWPRPVTEPILSGNAKQVYDAIRNGTARWRKSTTIARRTELDDTTLQAALGTLSAANHVRKHYVRSIDGDDLWDATAVVGLMPQK
jgi:transcription initiation factor IIF auxiliary subunit